MAKRNDRFLITPQGAIVSHSDRLAKLRPDLLECNSKGDIIQKVHAPRVPQKAGANERKELISRLHKEFNSEVDPESTIEEIREQLDMLIRENDGNDPLTLAPDAAPGPPPEPKPPEAPKSKEEAVLGNKEQADNVRETWQTSQNVGYLKMVLKNVYGISADGRLGLDKLREMIREASDKHEAEEKKRLENQGQG